MKGYVILVLGGLVLWASSPQKAAADIYRCKQRDGSIRYSNTRTKGRSCTVAVRSRQSNSGTTKKADSGPSKRTDRGRIARGDIDTTLRAAAELYQLPEAFLRAVMRVESNFKPQAVSSAGAIGLMQLMPRTAESIGVRNPHDPHQNIYGGARYLRILANLFDGDIVLTLAAYNAGQGAVKRYGGVPPYPETRSYVKKVLKHYNTYRRQS